MVPLGPPSAFPVSSVQCPNSTPLVALTDFLPGAANKKAPIVWTDLNMQAAFPAAKATLLAATLLVHPCLRAEMTLMMDASADHVGALP